MPQTPKKEVRLKAAAGVAPRIYSFSLVLQGASELTPEIADALYEAGCDDALVGSRDGVLFAEFDREASSSARAIISAIRQIESAGVGLTVVRIEPDEVVSAAEIADRVGLNRETIRLGSSCVSGDYNWEFAATPFTEGAYARRRERHASRPNCLLHSRLGPSSADQPPGTQDEPTNQAGERTRL